MADAGPAVVAAGSSRASSSTRVSSAETSQSDSRAMVWPTARVRCTARSKSISPESTRPTSVESACASDRVNAVAPPCSGKPSARHSRRAFSRSTPVSAASSAALKTRGSPRMCCSRSSPGRRLADGSSRSDTFVAAVVGVQVVSRSLSLRWVSSTCGMSGSATWPCVLASLITSVPQPSSRSIRSFS